MVSQRFFIGNLPSGTNENEVKKAFKDFGDITNIELKEKTSLVDPSDVKVLAFVTLDLYDGDVDFCLRKLNSKQINGEYVRVSLAKESFLERLKREREENTKAKPKTNSTTSNYELNQQSYFNEPIASVSNSKKVFNIDDADEDADYNDDEEPTLITKKRAANSIRNGKIVIESTNCSPIAVIGKKKDAKQLSDKSLDSDKKRKESVNKKKNQYQLQKSLIQKSLASVDSSKNKQIFFDNYEETEALPPPTSANGKQLFEDDSDDENNSISKDFAVKPEYEGARGAALMKLQSKMTLDPRFKVDSKFVDEVHEDEPDTNKNSERDWQYGILEQVVGNKVSNNAQAKGRSKNKLNMMRYDPSKENQEQYLIKPKAVEPMDEDNEEDVASKPEEKKVSKEVFYMVSENLSNSLKTRGDGFSLLSMFGRGSDEQQELDDKASSKEKILISKNDKAGALNPFSYDSSSESENEQENKSQQDNDGDQKTKSKSKGAKEDNKSKLFIESFFIRRNDIRLKEGKLFFRTNKTAEKVENYDEVKDKLKNIINRKIIKSKKQLTGIGKQKFNRRR